ncbi:MAG: hypothetical protein U0527_12575 [Candidatus Eisenbacteria bacterium]
MEAGAGGPSAESVLVAPPSARRETAFVARLAVQVLLLAAALLAFERSRPSGAASPSFEVRARSEALFADLAPKDQRIVRELEEGIAEAERRRARSGAWPSIEELARDGIPPFAPDPIDHDGYRWQLARDRTAINYAGFPTAPERPAFIVLILEPEPNAPPDPGAQADEIHHQLADGTFLHVTTWMGPNPKSFDRPITWFEYEPSWSRITRGAPAARR